jgi:hypothetical protein
VAFFILGGLTHGDEPNDLCRFSVDNHDDVCTQQSQRQKSRLAVIEAGVFERNGQPVKDVSRIGEIDAMLAKIDATFGFVPFIAPVSIVVTNCIAVKRLLALRAK